MSLAMASTVGFQAEGWVANDRGDTVTFMGPGISGDLEDAVRAHLDTDDTLLVEQRDASAGVDYLMLQQVVDGVPVFDGWVEARGVQGRLVMVRAHLKDVDAAEGTVRPLAARLGAEPARLVVFDGQLAWVDVARGRRRIVRADTHDVMRDESLSAHLSGTVTGRFRDFTVGQPRVTEAMAGIEISNGTDTTYADAHGYYELPGNKATVSLRSEHLVVWSPRDVSTVETTGGELVLDEQLSAAEVSAFVWANRSRERALALHPDQRFLQKGGVELFVNEPGDCGAYSDKDRAWWSLITFSRANDDCVNLAQVEGVVHHEYSHALMLWSRVWNRYIHEAPRETDEGAADYWACAMTDHPEVSPGASDDPAKLRRCDEPLVWPDDVVHDSHLDGRILSSALWDFRKRMVNRHGDAGADRADALFLKMMKGVRRPQSAYEELLAVDDDNGDLTDGTPNECDLFPAFVAHGLGPETGETKLKPPARCREEKGGCGCDSTAGSSGWLMLWAALAIRRR